MRLITSYKNVHNDRLSLFTHSVIDKTATSKFIANGSALVGPLTEAIKVLDDNVKAIVYPTPAEKTERQQLRTAVRTELGRLAAQLNLDYPANEEALRSSGLTLTTKIGHRRPVELGPPTEVELVDSAQPGCLCARAKRPRGTVQNLIDIRINPGTPEEQRIIVVGGGREREIGPFPSGSIVELTWACLSASTTEPVYCAPVRRRVQ